MAKNENIQVWDWGRTVWLYESHTAEAGGLSVGLVNVLPHARQEKHHHHTDEQFIYILQGVGKHIVNGQIHRCEPGDFIHIPPRAEHEMANTGAEDFIFLAVFTRAGVAAEEKPPKPKPELKVRPGLSPGIQRLAQTLASISGLSLTVLDVEGKFLLGPFGMPSVCRLVTGGTCPALGGRFQEIIAKIREKEEARLLPCCGRLQVVAAPLLTAEAYYGTVICGHGLLMPPEPEWAEEEWGLGMEAPATACSLKPRQVLLEELAKLPVIARSKMFHLAESFAAAVMNEIEADERLARERALHEETQRRLQLEETIHQIDMKLLRSQINPHFLFNTLNTLVGMATLEEAPKTAHLAAALAHLLRYTLGKSERLVGLDEVAGYLEAYFDIFRMRYEDKFRFILDLPPECRAARIPFMSLHPLVENAIVHGLEPAKEPGFLAVSFRCETERLLIGVENSGLAIDPGDLAAAREAFGDSKLTDDRSGLGLKIVRHQLEQFFGEDYRLVFAPRTGGGIVVEMELPFVTGAAAG